MLDFVATGVVAILIFAILLGIAGAILMGLFHWYLYIRREYKSEE